MIADNLNFTLAETLILYVTTVYAGIECMKYNNAFIDCYTDFSKPELVLLCISEIIQTYF